MPYLNEVQPFGLARSQRNVSYSTGALPVYLHIAAHSQNDHPVVQCAIVGTLTEWSRMLPRQTGGRSDMPVLTNDGRNIVNAAERRDMIDSVVVQSGNSGCEVRSRISRDVV